MKIFRNIALNCEVTTLMNNDEIYFKGKDIAKILGYVDTKQAIRKNVDDDDKCKLAEFQGGVSQTPLNNQTKNTIMINESGLYSLILRSKLKSAKEFKKWVTKDVLPSLRKTGRYDIPIHKKVQKQLTFNINTEFDLHCKVVNFLNLFYPDALITSTLGELQDTAEKRIKSRRQGYQKGSPDIIINNLHKRYSGFAIEFKTPRGTGVLSDDQSKMLKKYEQNNFKILCSNDYDEIITTLFEYMKDMRIKCQYCTSKFKSSASLRCHHIGFHKINI